MRTKLLLALFFCILPLRAATINWTNTAGGAWQTAANWSPNQIPGPADTANINASGTYTITLTGNITVHSVNLGGSGSPTISLTTQTLRVTNLMSVLANGVLAVQGGSLEGKFTIASGGILRLESSAQKSLYSTTLTNNGTVQWKSGNIAVGNSPTTIIHNFGLWRMESDDSFFLGVGGPTVEFNNSGSVDKTAGSGISTFSNLRFSNSGTVTAYTGTIQFNGMANAVLGGTFTANTGAVIQLGGGTYIENGAVFNSPGINRMTSGTLTLVNDRLIGLSLNGGDVKILPTFQAAGAITNLTLNGATLIGTNEVAGQLTLLAGALTDAVTVRPTGTITFSTTTQKSIYSLKLLNNGTVEWFGGNLAAGNTPTTLITNAGLWKINSDDSLFLGVGGPTVRFVNQGTVSKIGGSGVTSFSNLQFINTGLVEAQSGSIHFNSMANAILGGTFTALPGASIQFNGGTFTEDAAIFNGGGDLRVSNGTLTLVNNPMPGLTLAGGSVLLAPTFQGGAITNLTINGSTLDGTNEVAGNLTVLAGSLEDSLTIRPGGTLTFSSSAQKSLYSFRLQNNGTVRWFGGNLAIGNTPTTIITNAGLWEINSDNSMFLGVGGPVPVFENQGIVRKIGGSGVTAFSNLQFRNTPAGIVESQNGTIQFNGMQNAIIGGTFTAQPGATVQLNGGTYTESGGVFNGGGNLRMSNGTLTLVNDQLIGLALAGGDVRILPTFQAAGAITNLTISGATLIGTNEVAGALTVADGALEDSLTVRLGGTLLFTSAQQKGLYSLGLINHGTVKWNGGNLAIGNTPTTLITNFGLWEINSDYSMFLGVGGPVPAFYNFGTVRKIGGPGVSTFSNLQVVNGGLFEIQNGTIQITGSVGSLLGGNFTAAASSAFTLNGGTYIENAGVFSGPGALRMNNGALNLVTNVLPGLVLAGGDVRIGTNFQAGGAITNLTINGATLTGTNEIEGTLTLASGNLEGKLTVRPAGTLIFNSSNQKGLYSLTLNNNGTVLWQAGSLAVGNTPTTIINNAGLWNVTGDDSMFLGVGGPAVQFNNLPSGTVRKSAGSQVSSFSNLTFNNSGVVESQSGIIRFPNNYSHITGTLRLNGGRIDASGTLTFASGALEGSGTFGPSVFTGGSISPGLNGPGKINFPSGLQLGSGVIVVIDAVNTTPGTGHDQLAVTGAVNLGGSSLQVLALPQMIVGTRLTIIDNDGADAISGGFNAFPEGWLFSNSLQLFRVRYATGTGNDVALIRDDGGVRLTSIGLQPDGSFLLNGLGTNFGIYTISATTNFTDWTDLGATTADSGGVFQFFDTNRALLRYRFYRSLGPGITIP